MKFKQEFEFQEYITFEFAKMQISGKFGRDYTVHYTTRDKVE